jgi:hypothetical protein
MLGGLSKKWKVESGVVNKPLLGRSEKSGGGGRSKSQRLSGWIVEK